MEIEWQYWQLSLTASGMFSLEKVCIDPVVKICFIIYTPTCSLQRHPVEKAVETSLVRYLERATQ